MVFGEPEETAQPRQAIQSEPTKESREVEPWTLIQEPNARQLLFAYEQILAQMRAHAKFDKSIAGWVRTLDFEREEFVKATVPTFKPSDRVRFVDPELDGGEWVVSRILKGYVHLYLSTDRCYTHFAKPEQLRLVESDATPVETPAAPLQKAAMDQGQWKCSGCKNMVSAWALRCESCGAGRPAETPAEPPIDWKAAYLEAIKQRDALQADAYRYRWLRDNTWVEGYWIDGADGIDTKVRVSGCVDHLDKAVDLERIKEAPGHKPVSPAETVAAREIGHKDCKWCAPDNSTDPPKWCRHWDGCKHDAGSEKVTEVTKAHTVEPAATPAQPMAYLVTDSDGCKLLYPTKEEAERAVHNIRAYQHMESTMQPLYVDAAHETTAALGKAAIQCVLATGLANAVGEDEKDSDGFDLSAGMFGKHVSAWIREVAAEYLARPTVSEPGSLL